MKKYNKLFLIGRFQGFHLGHKAVIDRAFQHTNNLTILVGSANMHRSTRNPFTFEERKNMIKNSINLKFDQTLNIVPLDDFMYNDTAWVVEVEKIINKNINHDGGSFALIGYNKDNTSNYLKMFPTIDVIEIESQFGTLNATEIREKYFNTLPSISEFIPDLIKEFMQEFAFTNDFKWLVDEFNYVRDYKRMWSNSPFPPVFVTVDNVVIQSGHILLIKRKECPFKGSLALPGGFLDTKETIVNAAVRELKEETRIADHKGEIPPAILKSFIKKQEVFDDPERSDRGRSITHAFLYELPNREDLYEVRGDDDAEHAQWYELSYVKSDMFMEDHWFIIKKMLNI